MSFTISSLATSYLFPSLLNIYSFSICRDWLGVALFLSTSHRKAYVNKSKKYEVRERGKPKLLCDVERKCSKLYSYVMQSYEKSSFGEMVLPFEGGKPHHLVFIDQDGLALAVAWSMKFFICNMMVDWFIWKQFPFSQPWWTYCFRYRRKASGARWSSEHQYYWASLARRSFWVNYWHPGASNREPGIPYLYTMPF